MLSETLITLLRSLTPRLSLVEPLFVANETYCYHEMNDICSHSAADLIK